MDRRTQGIPKRPVEPIKERVGQVVGNRHLETEGKSGIIRKGTSRAMDAVREVVVSEGKTKEPKPVTENGNKAMEAVRQVVEKE